MKGKILLLHIAVITIGIWSCSDARIDSYKKIVTDADSITIFYKSINQTIPVSGKDLPAFKNILLRDIHPESPRRLSLDTRIDLYKGPEVIGFLMVSNKDENLFVNFGSENSNFGFRLTYGIGMTIDNMNPVNHRH